MGTKRLILTLIYIKSVYTLILIIRRSKILNFIAQYKSHKQFRGPKYDILKKSN